MEETFPKTISISSSLDNALPLIIGDHNQLHQALLNLCVNARDAMPSGGSLAFTTSVVLRDAIHHQHQDAEEQSYVRITLSDTGYGMDKQTRERIFEPFYTTKEKGKGTGLGLAVVYGIIQSHHGYIDVESMPGLGTTFIIYLPLPASYVEPDLVFTEPEGVFRRGSETILVVEDEDLLLDLITLLLKENGYSVFPARDGEQAVDIYRQHHSTIDLVITDLGLPKMNGRETFKKMKTIDPNVKAILASGYLEPHEKQSLLKEGFLEIISKPYEPKVLFHSIRHIFQAKS